MANEATFPPLSYGALDEILNQKTIDSVTLQIMGYKRVPGSGPPRFRMLLNDGKTLFSLGILATQLNDMIEARNLEKFSIIKLNKYACTEIQPKKKIILCLEIEPLVSGSLVKEKISFGEQSCTQTQRDPFNTQFNISFDTQRVLLGMKNENASDQNGNGTLDCASQTQPPSRKTDQEIFLAPKPYVSSNKLSNAKVLNSSLRPTQEVKTSEILAASSSSSSTKNCSSLPPLNSKSSTETLNKSLNVSSVPGKHKHVIPILNLTPYQNKWVVQGRVIYKSLLVHYNTRKSVGKLFSFHLLDETGEIRVIAFGGQAEHLSEFLESGKTYYISNAEVQLAKGDSPLKCDFEIKVTENTLIEVSSDEINIPAMKFNFVPLNEIESLPKDSYVDVVGVCYNFCNVETIISKTSGREMTKRNIFIIDESKTLMLVCLWGLEAEKIDITEENSVIAIRNAKVSNFKGHSLSVTQGSMFFVDPNVPQTEQLKSWFQTEGSAFKSEIPAHGPPDETWNTIADIRSFGNEDSDTAEYFTVQACITMVQKEKCMYQSCPAPDCQKKVQDMGNGVYSCSKCNRQYNSFVWTMLLSLDISDFTGSIWVTVFRDTAESIIGMKSNELSVLRNENIDEYYRVLTNLQFQSFVFRLRSKLEVYNETKQLKTTVLEADPIEPVSNSRKYLTNIYRLAKILNHHDKH